MRDQNSGQYRGVENQLRRGAGYPVWRPRVDPAVSFGADWDEGEISDWSRGIVEPADAARYSSISLRGKSPPELDGMLWLNTGGRSLRLADLHGKYVLLDFWFTGCGPCHEDFPSMTMVHERYKDKRVVVIGVHRTASNPDAVRDHVAKIGLPFPVVLDHPDGRIAARFESHGIPDSYPCHVLISPEGRVLFDDRTTPHPTLRMYKLEIIRKLLLELPDGSVKP